MMQRDGSPAVLVLAVLCALSLSVAGQNSSGTAVLDLITPASEIEDLPGACNCTLTGISGVASVDDFLGCDNFLSSQGDDTYYCYVVSPEACPAVQASPRFSGAGYRGCNPEVDAVVAGAPDSFTLWELVAESPSLSFLATALEVANLTDTLASAGPDGQGYTLFAPSNYAIATFLESTNTTIGQFLASPKLLAILLNHVTSGTYNATQADEAGSSGGIPTLSPGLFSDIQASLEGGFTVTPTDAVPFQALVLANSVYGADGIIEGTVATADVAAGNGHLYIISNVIALLADVVTAVGNEPRLSTFTQALNVSGIEQLLSEDCPDPETAICKYSPITAFAPTNDAFDQLASDLGVDVEGLLALPELSDILLYHFTDPGLVTSPIAPEQMVSDTTLGTLYEGKNITVVSNSTSLPLGVNRLTGETLVTTVRSVSLESVDGLSSAQVNLRGSLAGYNGVAILIDEVLLPFALSSNGPSASPEPLLD
ncbi:hypothetical protein ACKKBG_A08305 [Auxenochlorella protothecoides x Auxenochlorella symbiontica]